MALIIRVAGQNQKIVLVERQLTGLLGGLIKHIMIARNNLKHFSPKAKMLFLSLTDLLLGGH